MVSHGDDVARQHFLVPLDPFIVIDVAFFALTEFSSMNYATPLAFFNGNHDMQAFVINHASNCIQRTISRIVSTADANQMETFARHRVLANRMETEPTDAIAPSNPARKRPVKISVVNRSKNICQVVVFPLRTNWR